MNSPLVIVFVVALLEVGIADTPAMAVRPRILVRSFILWNKEGDRKSRVLVGLGVLRRAVRKMGKVSCFA